ncbi:MAG: hypothetical protein HY926_11610 [Elusimicrobia bacterium]|nr:hypothetical protein [Elusimicrobiota bacterium]
MGAGVLGPSYQPTPSEKEECARLLAGLRLPADVGRRYRRDADEYLAIFSQAGKARRPSGGALKFATRRCALFRRDYLVAYADAAWLLEKAPGTNAFATPAVWLGPIESPPLILLPQTKEHCHDPAFLSILEHELIHVHQFLLGTCPTAEPATTAGWLKDLFGFTRAEYEADMIQLVRCPLLYDAVCRNHEVPLQQFCALRGYASSMEKVFLAMAAGRLAQGELLKLLDGLPAALPAGFRHIGLDEHLGLAFARALPRYVAATLEVLTKLAPGLSQALRPNALMSWLEAQAQPGADRGLRPEGISPPARSPIQQEA